MASVPGTEAIFVLNIQREKMQIIILGLLAMIALLIGGALYLWRTKGWRNKKQWIVMLIVLAAALQLVNVTLMMTSQRLSG
jgi:predicted membrane channel-forming protein YqfA (hemolysin III family)